MLGVFYFALVMLGIILGFAFLSKLHGADHSRG